LAGIWLFENQPGWRTADREDDEIKGFRQLKKDTWAEIKDALSDKSTLNCARASTIRGSGPMVVIDRETFSAYPFANPL
jgi:hypothetical protein